MGELMTMISPSNSCIRVYTYTHVQGRKVASYKQYIEHLDATSRPNMAAITVSAMAR